MSSSSIICGRAFPCWIQTPGFEGTTAWNQSDVQAYEERIKKQMEDEAERVNARPAEASPQPEKKFYGNQHTKKG